MVTVVTWCLRRKTAKNKRHHLSPASPRAKKDLSPVNTLFTRFKKTYNVILLIEQRQPARRDPMNRTAKLKAIIAAQTAQDALIYLSEEDQEIFCLEVLDLNLTDDDDSDHWVELLEAKYASLIRFATIASLP